MAKREHWHHVRWGIDYQGIGLLGRTWREDVRHKTLYDGEPGRALLFETRDQARKWCRAQHEKYKTHSYCSRWRFRPVRVEEIVRPIEESPHA